MTSVPSKLYSDDVSLVVVLFDTNPFFWTTSSSLSFSQFLSHVLAFVNSILLLNQLNQVVVIASGYNTCDYIYDSSSDASQLGSEDGRMPSLYSNLLQKLEEFMIKDEKLGKEQSQRAIKSSLLSGSLSMALCYIQRVFRSGPLHPQPRGSPDGPEQYVAVMNAIFSSQRSMVPIDSCYVGAHNSAFLQQASYITGGVYVKPQHLDGLFQYLTTVFATDLHSRSFIQLPRPAGVDFRASCFCHKTTIDMGYICSVCLSIFCNHHKKCSTCGIGYTEVLTEGISFLPITCLFSSCFIATLLFIFGCGFGYNTGQFLAKPNQILPQHQILRERLQKHNLSFRSICIAMICCTKSIWEWTLECQKSSASHEWRGYSGDIFLGAVRANLAGSSYFILLPERIVL